MKHTGISGLNIVAGCDKSKWLSSWPATMVWALFWTVFLWLSREGEFIFFHHLFAPFTHPRPPPPRAPAPAQIKSLNLLENAQCTMMRGGWQREESGKEGWLNGGLKSIFSGYKHADSLTLRQEASSRGTWRRCSLSRRYRGPGRRALVSCSRGSAGSNHLHTLGPSGRSGRSRGRGDVSSPCLVMSRSSEWSQCPGSVRSRSLPEGFLSAGPALGAGTGT